MEILTFSMLLNNGRLCFPSQPIPVAILQTTWAFVWQWPNQIFQPYEQSDNSSLTSCKGNLFDKFVTHESDLSVSSEDGPGL